MTPILILGAIQSVIDMVERIRADTKTEPTLDYLNAREQVRLALVEQANALGGASGQNRGTQQGS